MGYDLPHRQVEPGGTLRIALYWQALENLEEDYLLTMELRDQTGAVQVQQVDRPVDSTYPTTQWDQGEVLRDWHDVGVPADTPQGAYDVFLQVLKGESLLGEVSLGQVEVKGRPHHFTIPEVEYPLQVMVGENMRLLGYDLPEQEVRSGEVLRLILYWQPTGEMEVSYTVFTHLLDGSKQIRAQKDSIPGDGALPTTSWVEEKVITDLYELLVGEDAPSGNYVLEVGMYEAATGQRLPVYDAGGELLGDRLLLATIRVLP